MVVCNDEIVKEIGRYLQNDCDKLVTVDNKGVPIMTLNNRKVKGFVSIVTALVNENRNSHFGKTAEDEALVRQWIEYAVCYGNYIEFGQTAVQVMKELNGVLSTRAYLVGNCVTLADIVLYHVLYTVMIDLTYQEKEKYLHLSRWFNNIQQDSKLRQNKKIVNFSRTLLFS